MRTHGTRISSTSVASLLTLLVLVAVLALAACCGSTPATSASPSPATTTSAAAGDGATGHVLLTSTETAASTLPVAKAYARGWPRHSLDLPAAVYAPDLKYTESDTAIGTMDRSTLLKYYRPSFAPGGEFGKIDVSAIHAGEGRAIVELFFHGQAPDSTFPVASASVIALRSTKVAADTVYYEPGDSAHVAVTGLAAAPRASDTRAAAEAAALAYATALQARDTAALAKLRSADDAFLSTSGGEIGADQATASYQAMFGDLGMSFSDLRYSGGPGWAAVTWRAVNEAGVGSALGLTFREVRGGTIDRETLCYSRMSP